MYSYVSERRPERNGLRVEVQLRTELQHQWATAVETVGAFRGEALKSGRGDTQWLRFFALMSSRIAHFEGRPPVPGTPDNQSLLIAELTRTARELNALTHLNAFQVVADALPHFRAHRANWIVLELDVEARTLRVRPFKRTQDEAAISNYLERESMNRNNPHADVVLVSANSISNLRRAYPNYFADITAFRKLVQEALEAP